MSSYSLADFGAVLAWLGVLGFAMAGQWLMTTGCVLLAFVFGAIKYTRRVETFGESTALESIIKQRHPDREAIRTLVESSLVSEPDDLKTSRQELASDLDRMELVTEDDLRLAQRIRTGSFEESSEARKILTERLDSGDIKVHSTAGDKVLDIQHRALSALVEHKKRVLAQLEREIQLSEHWHPATHRGRCHSCREVIEKEAVMVTDEEGHSRCWTCHDRMIEDLSASLD